MRFGRMAFAFVVGSALGSTALAGTVYINPGSEVTATETGGRGEARYRLTSNNWDQSILNGSPGGSNQISNELGNQQSLSNVWFRYTLSHAANQGYTMTMVNHGLSQTNTAGASHTLIWRDDALNVDNGNTLKSRSQLNSQTVTSNGAVHMLLVNSQATSAGGSMEWDQISFTASGQTIVGGLTDMNSPPSVTQRIVSTADFRTFDWQLDGWVRGNIATGGESQKFWVNFKDASIAVVPLPAAAWMGMALLGSVGGVGFLRKRPQQQA